MEVQFTSCIWPPICCTRTTKGSSIVSIEPISTSNLIIIQFQLGFQDSLFEAMRTRYCAVKDYWKKIWDGEITIGRNPKTFRRHRRHCKWKFMVIYLLFSHFDFDKEMSLKWPHTALKSQTTLTWVKWACTRGLQDKNKGKWIQNKFDLGRVGLNSMVKLKIKILEIYK